MVATAGVVEEIAREGWAPVFEDLDEVAIGDHFGDGLFHGGSNSYSVQDCLDDVVWIVEGYGALRIDGEGFASFFELPAVDAGAETKTDAGVVFEVARGAGDFVEFEVLW